MAPYKTLNQRLESRNLGKLAWGPTHNSNTMKKEHRKSTNSMVSSQSFPERMKKFEQTKKEHLLKQKEEISKLSWFYFIFSFVLDNKELKE